MIGQMGAFQGEGRMWAKGGKASKDVDCSTTLPRVQPRRGVQVTKGACGLPLEGKVEGFRLSGSSR